MKTCNRCGKCCLADFSAYVTGKDIERWRHENRPDILICVEDRHALWVGDHFILPDGRYLHGCTFHRRIEGVHACVIYETRPLVCREFSPAASAICPQYEKDASCDETES